MQASTAGNCRIGIQSNNPCAYRPDAIEYVLGNNTRTPGHRNLSASERGTLTQVCVSEGERVKRGQSLFIIDQVPYEAALQTALANVEAAKASLATAQLTYDSKQELYKQNVVSAFDLSTAKNSLLAAQAQLAQMKAQEVNARNNLSYTLVKSPADGVVGTLPLPGRNVGECQSA